MAFSAGDRAALLDGLDVGDLSRRVLRGVRRYLRYRVWQGVRDGSIPGGLEPDDLATDALVEAMCRVHRWDPHQENLDEFVVRHALRIVWSRSAGLVRTLENRLTIRSDETRREDAPHPGENPCQRLSPEEVLIHAEQRRTILANFDDPIERRIAESVLDGDGATGEDIAIELEISIDAVRNAFKRFRRNGKRVARALGMTDQLR